jgi:hypothetical protein
MDTSNNWGGSLRWTSIPSWESNAPSRLMLQKPGCSSSDEPLIGSGKQPSRIYFYVGELSFGTEVYRWKGTIVTFVNDCINVYLRWRVKNKTNISFINTAVDRERDID